MSAPTPAPVAATPVAAVAAVAAVATAPARRRAWGGWAAIAVVMIGVGALATVIAGISQLPAQGMLDPEAAGADGSRALARILAEQGIDVVVARDRGTADAALAHGDATLALIDTAPLSDEAVREIARAATDVVLLQPRSRDLRLLLPGATTAGAASGLVDPACDLPDAQRAGGLAPGILFAAGADTTRCYPSGDGYGLIARDGVTAVDATALFTNERLAADGNASLGVNLLGRHATLVWYLPGLADSDIADTTPSIGDLTPGWVTPALLLLIAAAVAAGVWRGRRFGPLVAENLPVTVRASETSEGRARLYARAHQPGHAADELRIGLLRRLAARLGLGPSASASEIADATALLLGADRSMIRDLLRESTPATDRELVDLADRLRALEAAAIRSARPESTPERNRE